MEKSGYPETSLDLDKLINKLRDGYSFSRFGDGEYSMIMSPENNKIYFDHTTNEARERLLRLLQNPVEKHLIGIISKETLTNQLTFANALSAFRNFKIQVSEAECHYFLNMTKYFSQYIISYLSARRKCFEAGLFRNTAEEKHREIWDRRDVLYVTGSIETSRDHGIEVYHMFENANSLEIIETVTEKALSTYYTKILNTITAHPSVKEKMVLLSQGMAGTVLAYDLAKSGIHAIDLGQPFVNYRRRTRGQ